MPMYGDDRRIWKNPVDAASTADVASRSGLAQTIDGVALNTAGMRVLLKDQSTASENGIYDVQAGAWQRSRDCDGADDYLSGMVVPVQGGTVNGGRWFSVTTSGTITPGTTSVTVADSVATLLGGISGDLDLNGQKIVNMADGTAASDGATYGQILAIPTSLAWQPAVSGGRYFANLTIAGIDLLGALVGEGFCVVATDAGTPAQGTSSALVAGSVAEWNGTSWIEIVVGSGGFVPATTRLVVESVGGQALTAPLTAATDESKVATFDGTTNTPTLAVPSDGWTVSVAAENSLAENRIFAYDENAGRLVDGAWTWIGNMVDATDAGNGLVRSGFVLAVDTPAGGGLKFNGSAQLVVEPGDFAGLGLVDDGTDALTFQMDDTQRTVGTNASNPLILTAAKGINVATDNTIVTLDGSGALTVKAGSVNNATLADMAQSTIKGRAAGAGTGDPVDLTAIQTRTILDVQRNTTGVTPPTTAFDSTQGYAVGSTHTDTVAQRQYLCVDASVGAAVWILPDVTAAGAPGVGDDDLDLFVVGSRWYDTSGSRLYLCADPSTGVALWDVAVLNADYDAQSVLVSVATESPSPVTIADSQFVGRPAGGNVGAVTKAQALTILNVEDGADVTDATNVDAAGAVMNTDTSTAAMFFVIDEDNMASDSATKVPTQQSVKAYVDAVTPAATTVVGNSSETTTSATPVLVAGMTITPGAGTYLVFFDAQCDASGAPETLEISIYENGTVVTDSECQRKISAAGDIGSIGTHGQATVAGGQAIEGRFKSVSGGSVGITKRRLTVMKVS